MSLYRLINDKFGSDTGPMTPEEWDQFVASQKNCGDEWALEIPDSGDLVDWKDDGDLYYQNDNGDHEMVLSRLDADEQVDEAHNLDELLQILRDMGEESKDLDWSDLPTFGGDEPEDTSEVRSWDHHRILCGTGQDLSIAWREDMALDEQKDVLIDELDIEPHELFYRETFMVSDLSGGEPYNQPGWYYCPFGENEKFLGRTAASILARM